MYEIVRTNDLASLFAQPELWNRLAGGVPFRETSWLATWWQHFGGDREPFVLVARDRDQVVRGILPLYFDHHASGRTLRMVGDGVAFSDYVSILCEKEHSHDVAVAMGTFLADSNSGENHWNLIDIDGVVVDDAAMITLANTLMKLGGTVHAQSRMHTWFRPVKENWEEHLKLFSKTQRRKMRRWSEKVDKIDGLAKHNVTSADQVGTTLDSLIELHQRRWASVGEPGSFADPKFRSFIHDCVADFYVRGRLHLPTLTYDDAIISGELHFIGGDQRLYCYSSGYDIDQAELEPGRILVVETLLDLYRNNWAGIDFLRGDEPYKKRMSAEATRVLRLRIAAASLVPQLKQAAWSAGFEMKQWARRRTGRNPIVVVDVAASQSEQVL